MLPKLPNRFASISAALLFALLLCGCRGWRVPAIDPTGQRIFAPAGSYTTFEPQPFAGFGQPAFTAPPAPGPCLDLPPTLPPQVGPAPAAPAVVAPQAVAPNVVPALPASSPVNIVGGQRGSIVLTPTRLLAPVGTEVVLKAGLCGGDGFYVVDQPIEWAMSQESVGHLVAVGRDNETRLCDRMLNNDRRGHRDATYAEGRTLSQRVVLRRPNAGGTGQVEVLNGQSWVSVTSLAEGVSRVGAMAPNVHFWNGRAQTAVIEWIDAQWSAPAPAIARAGTQHVLTTNVSRSTDGTPLVGWIVRYEVIEGSPAQFVSYEGAAGVAADATTDSNGQASVTISPTTNGAGTTHVRIHILRPASADGSRPAIAVGDAHTSVTWSAPGLAASIVGPQQASAGEVATYHIEVSNPGDMPVTNVDVTHVLSPEMSYLGSSPPGQVFGNRIQWRFPAIDPGMIMGIDVSCRVDGGGDAAHHVTVSSAEGVAAETSTVTRVLQNGLTMRMTGPVTAQVGQLVTFNVAVTNQLATTVTNARAAAELPPGLSHASGVSRIELPIGNIDPGQTVEFPVELTVTQPGEHCHVITISGDSGHFTSARACVVASPGAPGQGTGPLLTDPSQPSAPPAAPTPAAPAAPPQPGFEVRVDTANQAVQVGQITQFNIVVTNTGTAPLANIRVTSKLDPQLVHSFAEGGFLPEAGGIYWNLPQIPIGHQVVLRVQARCAAAAPRACHYATAQADQLAAKSAEGCVQIVTQANKPADENRDAEEDDDLQVSPTAARRGGDNETADQLQLVVSPLGRNILVGDTKTCLIRLKNTHSRSDQDIRLTLELPTALRIEQLLDGPAEIQSFDSESGLVTFEPIRELRAGEEVVFRVQLRSRKTGRSVIQAHTTSRRQMEAVSAETAFLVQ